MRMGHGIQGGAASVQLSSLVEWRGLPLQADTEALVREILGLYLTQHI